MIRKMSESSGNTIGFLAIGNLEKEDFDTLSKEVQAAIDEFGSARLLIDLQQFVSEEVSAWGADLDFAYSYHGKIERMAVVGDQEWQEIFASQAEPFYAKETKYFHVFDRQSAWRWLKED